MDRPVHRSGARSAPRGTRGEHERGVAADRAVKRVPSTGTPPDVRPTHTVGIHRRPAAQVWFGAGRCRYTDAGGAATSRLGRRKRPPSSCSVAGRVTGCRGSSTDRGWPMLAMRLHPQTTDAGHWCDWEPSRSAPRCAVAVGVTEAAGIDLVDHRRLPPGWFSHQCWARRTLLQSRVLTGGIDEGGHGRDDQR